MKTGEILLITQRIKNFTPSTFFQEATGRLPCTPAEKQKTKKQTNKEGMGYWKPDIQHSRKRITRRITKDILLLCTKLGGQSVGSV